MKDILTFLKDEGMDPALLDGLRDFRAQHKTPEELTSRVPSNLVRYLGTPVWEKSTAALLSGKNLLLAGPKATGKNVLAESLAEAFGRPVWNVSFHIGADASSLVGTDTYDGERVVFREGPVTKCARYGGFGILDEINMARNEALAVLHSALDFRRILDIPGYELVKLEESTRFIATMNYGYAGTRDLNEALASRFVVLDMPLITRDNLIRLIREHAPKLRSERSEELADLFFDLEKKAESAEVSGKAADLRGLLDAIDLCGHGLSAGDALTMCIADKTFDPYEKKLITDVIDERIDPALKGRDLFD
ncbi:MAG: MoxR family ATPase [Oribacterium sp.]|nr:MoxR family ATPase [Oribacterium sp.]